MASTWSALKIELLETGQNPGTWGTLTNVNLGDAVLGEAITGSATVDFPSAADVTITLADSATTQAARNLRLNITESGAGVGYVGNLILGANCQIEKFYLINNTGTGAKTVKNTTGTGISVPAGKATLVYNNGTNVVDAASYFTSLTLGTDLAVADGGTGLSTLTANNVILGNGASSPLFVAPGTSGNLLTSNGTTWSSTAPAVSGVTTFTAGTTGFTPSSATSGAVTLAGTLATTNGGTGLTSFTSGGVVFASSASVLATGSALTFDGTILRTFNSSASQVYFQAGGGTPTTNYLQMGVDGAVSGVAYLNDFFGYGLAFRNAGTEAARIVSGNLGIGTSSPVAKLHLKGSGTSGQVTASWILENASSGTAGMDITGSAGASRWRFLYGGSPSTGTNALTESMCILTEGASAGNVGIGTSSPGHKLDVQSATGTMGVTSTTGTNISYVFSSNTGGSFIIGKDSSTGGLTGTAYSNFLYNASAYPTVFFTNGSEKVRITSAGGFSVGTTSDPGAGAIYATGNITAFFSDKRLKTVSGKIENALDKVGKLSGVYYTFNDTAKSFGYDSDEEQVGVIAQDVEAVLPQIVKAAPFDLDENNNSKSGENYKTVQYEKLIPLLIEAINELRAEVKALKGA